MPDTTDVLQSLRDEAADFLATDSYFWEEPAVPVLSRIDKQQFNELQLAIETKLKLAVTLQVGAAKPAPNGTAVPGPFYEHIDLEAHCFENRNLNDTGKSVERLSDIVAAVLQNYVPAAANGPLLFQGNDVIQTGDPAKVLRIVRFRAKGGLSYSPSVVATPAISNVGLNVSITCATSGASIYYTTDQSIPTNATGALYTVPFDAVEDGVMIRARAYKSATRASLVATHQVSL
jgi:hypothetical protein